MAGNEFDPATVKPDGRPPAHARLFDPATEGPWGKNGAEERGQV